MARRDRRTWHSWPFQETICSPDLEQYVEGKKRKFTTYSRGASLYSMNYYSFVNLAKEAGANIQIKKKVIVDLDILEKYIEEQCREEGTENV